MAEKIPLAVRRTIGDTTALEEFSAYDTLPLGNIPTLPLNKLAPLTASRVLVAGAGGIIEASATTAVELGYLSGVTSSVQTQLNAKEASIASGTTAQYWRGDKAWTSFSMGVREAALTGLSTAKNAIITATDTVLEAFGKLQAQFTAHFGNTSNPHSVTAAQVGAPATSGTGATGTWGIGISGNAATATAWATGRTLTVGDTGKSVDGSGDVSWSHAEIGATTANTASKIVLRGAGREIEVGGITSFGGSATTNTMLVNGGATGADNASIASTYSLTFQVDTSNTVGGRWFNWRAGGAGHGTGTEWMYLDSSVLLVHAGANLYSDMLVVGGGIGQLGSQFNAAPGASTNYEYVNRNGTGFRWYVNSAALLALELQADGVLKSNADTFRLTTARTPASASASGNTGDVCWDASYLYICTATNTWRRIATQLGKRNPNYANQRNHIPRILLRGHEPSVPAESCDTGRCGGTHGADYERSP